MGAIGMRVQTAYKNISIIHKWPTQIHPLWRLFVPYFLNDSQNDSLNETFFQKVDFIMSVMPDVCEHSADLCTALPGNLYFMLQKWHLVAKNEFAFSFRPRQKTNKLAGNMLIFHVDVTMKRLGIHLKKDSFQWFRVDSFFRETITLYTVHFQISNFAGCFHSLRAVLHTAWKIIFKNP